MPTTTTWWEVHGLRHTVKEKVRLKSIPPPYNHDGLNGLDLQVNSTVFEMNVAHYNMRSFRMVGKLGTQISEKSRLGLSTEVANMRTVFVPQFCYAYPSLPPVLQFQPLTLTWRLNTPLRSSQAVIILQPGLTSGCFLDT